jgi:hypothetical protein
VSHSRDAVNALYCTYSVVLIFQAVGCGFDSRLPFQRRNVSGHPLFVVANVARYIAIPLLVIARPAWKGSLRWITTVGIAEKVEFVWQRIARMRRCIRLTTVMAPSNAADEARVHAPGH